MISRNYRFIEKDYWFQKTLLASEHLGAETIRQMLDDVSSHWVDYTFKFYSNGSVKVIDNDNDKIIETRELTGAALDFYVRCRIDLIRTDLQEKQLKYA